MGQKGDAGVGRTGSSGLVRPGSVDREGFGSHPRLLPSMLFIGGYLAFHGDGGLTVMSYFAILTLYLYIISFSFGWS